MEIDKEIIENIKEADIPNLLRDYLLRNKYIKPLLTLELLSHIEDLYVEYDSLYIFDEAEFCSYVITGLKKQDKHDYFYHYMKKILNTDLIMTSKFETNEQQEIRQIIKNASILNEKNIDYFLMELFKKYNNYKDTENLVELTLSHRIAGILDVLFKLYPANTHFKQFNYVSEDILHIAENRSENENTVT